MNARRWVELALVLLLGMLIGYWVAPSARYTVVHCREYPQFYRYDIYTGKTWLYQRGGWMEVRETNQFLPLPEEKK